MNDKPIVVQRTAAFKTKEGQWFIQVLNLAADKENDFKAGWPMRINLRGTVYNFLMEGPNKRTLYVEQTEHFKEDDGITYELKLELFDDLVRENETMKRILEDNKLI